MCRKRRAKELAIRCVLHASLSQQNCFLTLTYDEKKENYNNDLAYSDIQKFKKNLRRYCDYHLQKKIQIFNVHEYGKNGKKHWHLVVFNHDFKDKLLHTTSNGNRLYTSKTLSEKWPHGFSTIGDVTEASAMYQAQYTQKDIKNGNLLSKKQAKSNHSGIGRDYFLSHYRQILMLGYIPFQGKKIPVPRYFKKIAHKHYSHFYDTDNFFDFPHRKKLYTPFKQGEENKEIADLYIKFSENLQSKTQDLILEWDEVISNHLNTNEKPDFIKSAENFRHDQKQKNNQKEKF